MPQHFLGRDDELAWLDTRWAEPETGVVSIVAFGGVGKSALVRAWVEGLVRDGGRGARRVLGHSFYSQGSREDAGASSDAFIQGSLKLLGDPDPTAGSPWDKGERLARLVKAERTVLVLDGMEPLQYPPTFGDPGRIKDPALQSLVRELAVANPGLCVITTREAVADVPSAPRLDLEHLSDEAGAALLRALGVKGTQEELEAASATVKGHGLALRLLGTYLVKALGGDVRRIGEVDFSKADEKQGGHARKLMAKYVGWFGEGVEVSILRILGLFNRPAEPGCIEALRAEPAIPGLTDALVGLSEEDWNWAVSNLAACGLVAEAVGGDAPLDAHPLVREFFSDVLAEEFGDGSREAHRRLYEHLKECAPEYPDTLEEMMPLYHAIPHGCAAGLHDDAFFQVYHLRIDRARGFATSSLGAFGASLGAISSFFVHGWDYVSEVPSERLQSSILSEAGFLLLGLGRLADSEKPFERSLARGIDHGDWLNAAIRAGNLSILRLMIGNVAGAVRVAELSVEIAGQSEFLFIRIGSLTALVDTLRQAGRLDEARAGFRNAEILQERSGSNQYLYSVNGIRYCELLLDAFPIPRQAGCSVAAKESGTPGNEAGDFLMSVVLEVRDRAEDGLQQALDSRSLLDVGLNYIILGRTHLVEAVALWLSACPGSTQGHEALARASEYLEEGVQVLRQSGQQDELPRGLLARAELRRVQRDFAGADTDVMEVESIAERGGMLVYQVDAAVERTRLCLAQGDTDGARASLARAKALVKKTEAPYVPHVPMWEGWEPLVYEGVRYDNVFQEGEIVGYYRRNGEIEALEGELGDYKGEARLR